MPQYGTSTVSVRDDKLEKLITHILNNEVLGNGRQIAKIVGVMGASGAAGYVVAARGLGFGIKSMGRGRSSFYKRMAIPETLPPQFAHLLKAANHVQVVVEPIVKGTMPPSILMSVNGRSVVDTAELNSYIEAFEKMYDDVLIYTALIED